MNDLWKYLKASDRPIVIYGTGNGADKILDELDRREIPIRDIFASDGFIRNRDFRGHHVLSYADTVKKYGDNMIILLAFGSSLPDVTRRFYTMSEKHELYAPDVPVYGNELFDSEFYESNYELISSARALLADDISLQTFDSVINYRLSGDIKYLLSPLSSVAEVMTGILHPENYRVTLDLGAFNGDSAIQLMQFAPNIETVIALEPDQKNFAKLCFNTAKSGKVEPHYSAAWDRRELLTFKKGGGRGIHKLKEGKTTEVIGEPAENYLDGRKPDFIKFDVEGAESRAIDGCANAVREHSPELEVALYHRSGDMFELPLKLHEMNPSYRFYLRRFPYVPAWDLKLYAIKK